MNFKVLLQIFASSSNDVLVLRMCFNEHPLPGECNITLRKLCAVDQLSFPKRCKPSIGVGVLTVDGE